jgi:hypothetical protein
MKKWMRGLKQWFQWLVGEGGKPDRQAGIVLASTVALVVVLGAGADFALQNSKPAGHHQSAAAKAEQKRYRQAVALHEAHKGKNAKKGSSKAKSKSKSKKKVSHNPYNSSAYKKALGLALANRSSIDGTKSGSAANRKLTPAERRAELRRERHLKKVAGEHGRSAGTLKSGGSNASSFALGAPTGSSNSSSSSGKSNSSSGGSNTPLIQPLITSGVPAIAPVQPQSGPPSAPSVVAAPRNLGVAIAWQASPGSSITGYNVYAGTLPGAEYPMPINGNRLITGTSYVATHLVPGTTYYFTVTAVSGNSVSPHSNEVSAAPTIGFQPVGPLLPPVVAMASNPGGSGYWLVNSQGYISTQGSVLDYGSTAGLALNAPIVKIVSTPDGQGYWEVASDGGVFAYGDAQFYGSMGGDPLNAPIVGFVSTTDGRGYWEFASDGGVFAFGDAQFSGSTGGQKVNAPIVGMAFDAKTGGYWEVTSGGQVFAFGGAQLLGAPSKSQLNGSVVGIESAPGGGGYWVVTSGGGVFAYGSAGFKGSLSSTSLNAPVGGLSPDQATGGYWMFSLDGGTFAFGAPFFGAV